MRSMTGYSKLIYHNENFSINMEIKSVNNKNLNLKVKIPYVLNFLESKIRAEIGSKVNRGSVDLKIDFEDKRECEDLFEYNKNLSRSYMGILSSMEEEFGEKFSNKLDIMVRNLNVIKRNELEVDENEYEKLLISKLNELLIPFLNMKKSEGERLRNYFRDRVVFLEERVEKIKEYKEQVVSNYREKLIERMEKIKGDIEFSKEDMLKEILLFTDRSDISEEVSRLSSHLEQLKSEIESNDTNLGKRMDFILQEIFRELNTTGVKSNFYEISKLVVECKNEIEKIREQALNIE